MLLRIAANPAEQGDLFTAKDVLTKEVLPLHDTHGDMVAHATVMRTVASIEEQLGDVTAALGS